MLEKLRSGNKWLIPRTAGMLSFLLAVFFMFESVATAESGIPYLRYINGDVKGQLRTSTPIPSEQIIAKISSPDGQEMYNVTYSTYSGGDWSNPYYFYNFNAHLNNSYPMLFVDSTVTGSTYLVRNEDADYLVTPIISLASGGATLALKSGGTVYAWGRNDYGQVGDGSKMDRLTPYKLPLQSIIGLAAGENHSVALHTGGVVFTWGDNSLGQLADGTQIAHSSPKQIPGLENVVAITDHLALRNDGTVWAWGPNNTGQIGDGTALDRLAPVQVQGLHDIYQIAGSASNGMALQRGGTVWVWGSNEFGQIGDGTTTNRNSPVQVSGISNVSVIAFASGTAVALKSDGTVWAWGDNRLGQVGINSTVNQVTPAMVPNLSSIKKIFPVSSGFFAEKTDGSLWGWGDNQFGQVGVNGPATILSPTPITRFDNAVAISGGPNYTVFADGQKLIWASGSNVSGNIGDNTKVDRPIPVRVLGLSYNANLTKLIISPGTRELPYFPEYYHYKVGPDVRSVTVTTYSEDPLAVVKVNGIVAVNDQPGAPIPIKIGPNKITVNVTPDDGSYSKEYDVEVNREAGSPSGIPVSLHFTDSDIRQGYIEGDLTWENPEDTYDIDQYLVYFLGSDGSNIEIIGRNYKNNGTNTYHIAQQIPQGATQLAVYPQSNYGPYGTPAKIPLVDFQYNESNLNLEVFNAFAVDRDPRKFNYSTLVTWSSIVSSPSVTGYKLEAVSVQGIVTPIPVQIGKNNSSSYSVDLGNQYIDSNTRYIRIRSIIQNGLLSTNYILIPVYDTIFSELVSVISPDGPENNVLNVYFYDSDNRTGTIGGQLDWTTYGSANNTDYFVYFLDVNKKRLKPIAHLYENSPGQHSIKLPSGMDIPTAAAYIGIYGHGTMGESSVPVVTPIWDAPYSIATGVTLVDSNPLRGAVDSTLTWYASQDETNISGYSVYYVDSNGKIIGNPISEQGKGQSVYQVTLPASSPSNAKYLKIYSVNTRGELSPVLYAVSLADDISSESPTQKQAVVPPSFGSAFFFDEDGGTGMIGGLVNWSSNVATGTFRVYFIDSNKKRLKAISEVPGYGSFSIYEITLPKQTAIPSGASGIGIFAYDDQIETLSSVAPIQDHLSSQGFAASNVTIVNNRDASDIITISNVSENDYIRVYRDINSHIALVSGKVASGSTSITLSVAQLGSIAGSIAVSVTRTGFLESNRVVVPYNAELVNNGGGGFPGGGPGPIAIVIPPSDQAVRTDIQKDESGKKIIVAQIEEKSLDDFIQKSLEANVKTDNRKTIVVEAKGEADGAKFQLTSAFIKKLMDKQSDSIISLQSDSGQLLLPPEVIQRSLDQLKGADLAITVSITKVSDESQKLVNAALNKDGLSSVVGPMDFQIRVTGSNEQQIQDITNTDLYIGHAFTLLDSVQLAPGEKLVGVVVDPKTGEYYLVPTKIVEEQGKSTAILYRKGNSVYTLVKKKDVTFSDVDVDHYANGAIRSLSAQGVISGYENGTFEPNRTVTRAEFANMIIKALGLPARRTTQNQFSDIKGGEWYADAVLTAYQNKLLSGYDDGTFRPEQSITRQEMAVILKNALVFAGYSSKSNAAVDQTISRFPDALSIAGWATEAVAWNTSAGIISGMEEGRFEPLVLATRAQCAVMIERLLKASGLMN